MRRSRNAQTALQNTRDQQKAKARIEKVKQMIKALQKSVERVKTFRAPVMARLRSKPSAARRRYFKVSFYQKFMSSSKVFVGKVTRSDGGDLSLEKVVYFRGCGPTKV